MHSFEKWVIVSFNDETGLGNMANEMKVTLGIKNHLVCKSAKLKTNPLNPDYELLFDRETDGGIIEAFLKNARGIICFEYIEWHPNLISICKKLNLKIVCVPMWEWFRGRDLSWKSVDLFLCPNQKALDIVQSYGFENAVQINWALNLKRLPKRNIEGPAKHFIHNAGIVDDDDRKGTIATIKAFTMVKNPEITLTVRIQKQTVIPDFQDSRIHIQYGNFPLEHLYSTGDVAVQPSKMEGLGFMVLEPICCGIPVITNDIPPMNEYGASSNLRVSPKWFRRNSFAKVVAKIKHAYMREPCPHNIAKAIDWCTKNSLTDLSRNNRAWAETQFGQGRLQNSWETILKTL